MTVGMFGLGGLLLGLLWWFFNWLRKSPVTPNPWDEETEKRLHGPEAVEICYRCFAPRNETGWFCEHCGCATGPYNNLMPFVWVFSEGEVFRNGVNDRLRTSKLVVVGYLVSSVAAYHVFAPVFWVAVFRNLRRQQDAAVGRPADGSGTAAPDSHS